MGLFTRADKGPNSAPTAQAGDVATVRAKLADTEKSIAAAEAKLRQASLAAALSDDSAEADRVGGELTALRGRKEILLNALHEAERIEQERLAALRGKEDLARKRSLAQHSGRAIRSASEVNAALVTLNQALDRLVADGQAITALLPAHLRCDAAPFHEFFSDRYLSELMVLEHYRVAGAHKDRCPTRPRRLGEFESFSTGTIKPLTAIITDLTASLRQRFDGQGPQKDAAKDATPFPLPASGEQASSALVASGDVAPTSSPVAGSAPSEVVNLCGRDLGIAKEQPASAEPAADAAPAPAAEPEPTMESAQGANEPTPAPAPARTTINYFGAE